jgi:hypothetical protein
MVKKVSWTDNPRAVSPDEKFKRLERIKEVFTPLSYHVELVRYLDRAIQTSYEKRNPLNSIIRHRLLSAQESPRKFSLPPGIGKSDCNGFAIAGDSGVGKSVAVEQALAFIPQVINHTDKCGLNSSFRQVTWIKVNCPESCSAYDLCVDIIKAYDSALDTHYTDDWVKKSTKVYELISHVVRLAFVHGTGIIVIDATQNLKGLGGIDILGFTTTLMHRVGLPVILIGTCAAIEFLSSRFSQARRVTGYPRPIWTRLDRGLDWQILLAAIWKFDFLAKPAEMNSEIDEEMHTQTRGLPDSVAKLFKAVQEKLVFLTPDKQVITKSFIRMTATGLFSFQHRHLRVIDGNTDARPRIGRKDGEERRDYLSAKEKAELREGSKRPPSGKASTVKPKRAEKAGSTSALDRVIEGAAEAVAARKSPAELLKENGWLVSTEEFTKL